MSLPRIPCPQELGEIPYDPQSKRINVHIRPDHFRMETLRSILPLLRPGDWTASIDLKDAYHHVPIAPASRDLLGFTVAGGTYRFKALPFGLRPAPRLFTRLVACVAAFLRQRGLRLFGYLDDWLLAAESRDVLSRQLHFLLQTVQAVGFLVNWKKSELAPTRRPTFLHGCRLAPPPPAAGPSQGMAPISGVPGQPSRCAPGLPAAHASPADTSAQALQPIQGLTHAASAYPPDYYIRLHLVRWSRRDFLNSGNPLRVAQSSITVTTDASRLGWGGHCLGNAAFGDWPRADTLSHINVLEFLAVLLSLRSFLPLLRRRTVLIRTDNVTVAAYINKQGGTHSTRLNALAALLWK